MVLIHVPQNNQGGFVQTQSDTIRLEKSSFDIDSCNFSAESASVFLANHSLGLAQQQVAVGITYADHHEEWLFDSNGSGSNNFNYSVKGPTGYNRNELCQ